MLNHLITIPAEIHIVAMMLFDRQLLKLAGVAKKLAGGWRKRGGGWVTHYILVSS